MLAEKEVKEWVAVIRVAVDPASPFAGMVDLSELLKLPVVDQKQIFAALPEEIQAEFQIFPNYVRKA